MQEQREEMDELRAEVEELGRTLTRSCDASLKAVLRLREEREGADRREGLLRQSLGDLAKVEGALRSKLSSQDEELERQKCQLSLLETRVEGRDSDINAQRQELAQLRDQAQEAQRREHEARRELSLSAGSRDAPSQAELVALKSLVEAKEKEVNRLNEEMEAQQLSNEARIVGIQSNFQQKVCELRKVHSKQLEAVEKEKTEIKSSLAQERECQRRLEQRAARAIDAEESLKDYAALQEEFKAFRQEREAHAGELEQEKQAMEDAMTRMARENEQLERSLQRAQKEAQSNPTSQPASAPLNEAALQTMEQQLVRLSQVIRKKEDELREVRETVQLMCSERNEMLHELQSLRLNTVPKANAERTPPKAGKVKAAASSPSKALELTRKPNYRR